MRRLEMRPCIVCGAAGCSCGGATSVQPVDIMSTPKTRGMWISPRRLCLNAQGEVVEANSPERVSLLVGAGCAIPLERAVALGLVEEDGSVSRETDESTDEPIDEGAAGRDAGADPTAGAAEAPGEPEREGAPRALRTLAVVSGD